MNVVLKCQWRGQKCIQGSEKSGIMGEGDIRTFYTQSILSYKKHTISNVQGVRHKGIAWSRKLNKRK
jgi:hypothetical protein